MSVARSLGVDGPNGRLMGGAGRLAEVVGGPRWQ